MVGPNRHIKAPKVNQKNPPGKIGHAKSSMRKPKPKVDPSYGIANTSRFGSQADAAAKAARMFGNGSANSSNQGQIARKAKRQVG